MTEELLNSTEAAAVFLAYLRGSGRGLTKDELGRAFDWAWDVRLEAALLDAVLGGRVLIDYPDGGEQTLWPADDAHVAEVAALGLARCPTCGSHRAG